MKPLLLFLVLILLFTICCVCTSAENIAVPHKVRNAQKLQALHVKPGGGIGNKMRIIVAHLSVDKPLIIYWPRSVDCTGTFLDCFKPIKNVTFVVGEHSNKKYDYAGFEACSPIVSMYHPQLTQDNIKHICTDGYRHIQPLPKIQRVVDAFVKKHNIKSAVAVHVRRTDFVKILKKRHANSSDYADFFSAIDALPPHIPIFLATDNRQTQLDFIKKYPGRVSVYKDLSHKKLRGAQRLTSMEDSVIDMYVAKDAKYFIGTPYSSFSDMIGALRLTTTV